MKSVVVHSSPHLCYLVDACQGSRSARLYELCALGQVGSESWPHRVSRFRPVFRSILIVFQALNAEYELKS